MKRLYVLSLIAIIILVGCAPEQVVFPQTDIVYQAIDFRIPGEPFVNTVGFIDSDGTNSSKLELKYRPSKPVYSNGLKGLLFLDAKNPVDIFGLTGTPVFLSESGKYKVCDVSGGSYDFSFPIPGTRAILVNSGYELVSVDIDNCEVVKTFVVTGSNNDISLINSAHISQSGNMIVLAVDWGKRGIANMARIMLLDIQTGEITELPFTGGNPTLSPDDGRIAYMGVEGIYVYDIVKNNKKLLVPINSESVDLGEKSPYPFWSPDGKWLTYHKCINNQSRKLKDYSIFIVSVDSGKELKIKDEGMFPVWVN